MIFDPCVDVVIPAYNEDSAALRGTVEACLSQTLRPHRIWVVDDGSDVPIKQRDLPDADCIRLIRFSSNHGISAARNAALSRAESSFVLMLNVDILLEPDWLETGVAFLIRNEQVAACGGRTLPKRSDSLLTKWRYQFLEAGYEQARHTHTVPHLTGHAVLFRAEPLKQIGGYDERLTYFYEDSDVCYRLQDMGYLIKFVGGLCAQSLEENRLDLITWKHLRNNFWALDSEHLNHRYSRHISPVRFVLKETGCLIKRLGRNLLKARWRLIPVDVAVYLKGIIMGLSVNYEKQHVESSSSEERVLAHQQ